MKIKNYLICIISVLSVMALLFAVPFGFSVSVPDGVPKGVSADIPESVSEILSENVPEGVSKSVSENVSVNSSTGIELKNLHFSDNNIYSNYVPNKQPQNNHAPADLLTQPVICTSTEVNPLYASSISEDYIMRQADSKGDNSVDDATEYMTVKEAGAALRGYMKNRIGNVKLRYYLTDVNADIKKLMGDIITEAKIHTGDPTEGDYIAFQYEGYHCSASGNVTDDHIKLLLEYTIPYYSSREQEGVVDEAVGSILESLDLKGKTTFEKIQTIYDHIRASVDYDCDHDEDYIPKYTAYGALIDHSAVCQGYAVALYRLLLESGIDCRVIAGIGDTGTETGNHGWIIIRFGNKYYNADPTWDDSLDCHDYFMKCPAGFDVDHMRNERYLTEEFMSEYPMWTEDCDYAYAAGCIDLNDKNMIPDAGLRGYVGGIYDVDHDGLISEEERVLSSNDTIEVSDVTSLEGLQYFDRINNLILNDCEIERVELPAFGSLSNLCVSGIGIEYINAGVLLSPSQVDFSGCSGIKQIIFGGDAPSFADNCFAGCAGTIIYYPDGNPTWDDTVFGDYGGSGIEWKTGDETTAYYDANTVLASMIILSHTDTRICSYKTLDMDCMVFPTNVTDGSVTWSSSDEEIAAVDQNGLVTALRDGEVVITVAANDESGISATCHIIIGHDYAADVKEPTCTQDGYTSYKCSICGDAYLDFNSFTPATGHIPVIDPAIPATETHTGLTEGSHCSVCGEILVAQEVVPMTGVTPGPAAATATPTSEPDVTPTPSPTPGPTAATAEPTSEPDVTPTPSPTPGPTAATAEPTSEPDVTMTPGPTPGPTVTATAAPTSEPDVTPTPGPTPGLTDSPSVERTWDSGSTDESGISPDNSASGARVIITYAKNKAYRSVKLRWKRCSGASLYQIRYKMAGKNRWIKKISKKNRIVLKKLKKKKKYYIKVRAGFRTGDGMLYGRWSRKIKVKLKK